MGKHLTGGKDSIDKDPATYLRRNPRLCLDYLRPRQYCTDRAKYKRTNDTLRLRAASLLGKDVSVAAPK